MATHHPQPAPPPTRPARGLKPLLFHGAWIDLDSYLASVEAEESGSAPSATPTAARTRDEADRDDDDAIDRLELEGGPVLARSPLHR